MYSLHNHTGDSNASRGFADSSIKLEDLIKKAKEKGLDGIAITDHESVGTFVQCKKLEEKYDFPIICGNEIYLVSDAQYDLLKNDYEKGMYFPHFLLLALDEIGNEQLRRLSTIAWVNNGFWNGGLYRTPTRMSDIEKIIGKDKGHIVASTACLGGQMAKWISDKIENIDRKEIRHNQILDFIEWNKNIFGENNFYLEMQPSEKFRKIINKETKEEQLLLEMQYVVNNELIKYSKLTNTPLIITTDSHFLEKNLLTLHSKFLNSSDDNDEDNGRNVEEIYKTAYLMSEEEVRNYFGENFDKDIIDTAIENTIKIGKRVKKYKLSQKQKVPKVDYIKNWEIENSFFPNKGVFKEILEGNIEDDKYLLFRIQEGMKRKTQFIEHNKTIQRLEEELNEILAISKSLNENLGNYFITMEKLIEIIWTEGDSIVGVGRGSCSSSIIAFLLDIIQINPLHMPVEMPFWRFITKERVELPDIDIDTQSNRRLQIFKAVRNYFVKRGGDVVNCCTKGTIGSRSAIQIAGRGLGLLPEETQQISSLIPMERGKVWSLHDTYYGNEEENRQSITEFINLVNKYEGLFELAQLIEGVIISRGVHASGVFITNDDFNKYCAKMVSPKGIITSQWDLHDCEENGLLKYDFLTTKACTKIRLTLDFLIESGHIEKRQTLKDTYMNVINPLTMNYDNDKVWNTIAENSMMDLFQFSTSVAMQTVSAIKPHNLIELAQANSLMRLQKQPEALESPTETYVKFKNNIKEWYKEMDSFNVPKEDQKILAKVLEQYRGVADTQEAIMILTRLEEISCFTVKESHQLRKSIAKKSEKAYEEVKKLFYKKCEEQKVNINTANYIWKVQVDRQKGYSFSILHCLVYSFIALQELVLYTQYPPIYWNTSCLTVNAGAIDDEDEDASEKSTNYGKIASAIGEIQSKGIKVAIPHINKANFGFIPDEENNEIIFGLKGIVGLGDSCVQEIISHRPYDSLKDFHNKLVKTKKEVILSTGKKQNKSLVPFGSTISLIKAGAFDSIEKNKTRQQIMEDYLKFNFPDKKTLDMRAVDSVVNLGIVPEQYKLSIRINNFKNYIVTKDNFIKQDENKKSKQWYILRGHNESTTQFSIDFFQKYFINDMTENEDYYYDEQGNIIFACKLKSTGFEKTFDKLTKGLKQWLKSSDCLDRYNKFLFEEKWNKFAKGTMSKWEMDSLSFYYHEHELARINKEKYFISNFSNLPEEPTIEKYGKYKDREYPIYKLDRIAGTVLDKDKNKHIVTLLTINGEVVTLKFYSGQFGFYDKTISEQNNDGSKTTIEESWFKRGQLLIITGYRRGDQFKPKIYKDSAFQHTVTMIEEIREDGVLILKLDRARI